MNIEFDAVYCENTIDPLLREKLSSKRLLFTCSRAFFDTDIRASRALLAKIDESAMKKT